MNIYNFFRKQKANKDEQAEEQPCKKLCYIRYPKDLRPEHFVRREDYFTIKEFFDQNGRTAKRLHKRISRWKKKAHDLQKLLSDAKKQVSNETIVKK